MRTLFAGWHSSTPWQMAKADVDQYVFCHMYDHNMDDLVSVLDLYPAIIPLRHPALIYESTRIREGAFNKRVSSLRSLEQQFDNLMYIVDAYDPCYLVLDSAHRDKWLEQANKKLGTSLKTDWKPKTVFNTHDLKPTQQMIDRVPDKVNAFFADRILAQEEKWCSDN